MSIGKYLSSLTKPEIEQFTEKSNFTNDELKVFELLTKGSCITEIALKLSVCERTINRRIKDIESKISRLGDNYGKSNT